ncbi:MAG: UDP-N-acetylmuramoyl-L-alanyl-D-glutamate--2,6-diaminopimelate ligase [Planctomycetota bacterium JB042]
MDETRGMPELAELMRAVDPIAIDGDAGVRVRALAADSRCVEPGSVFFAVAGEEDDGARYLSEAVARGAAAVVVAPGVAPPPGVSVVWVKDVRRAKALAAASFHGEPSRTLPVVGVTGTNGKTTTAWMLRSIAEYDGGPTAMFGTVHHEIAGRRIPARNTTPDPIDLQRELAEGVRRGARLGIMEVSSHALVQERVTGIDFRAAVFTNLAPEHLDFHGSIEAYRDAKARLFESLDPSAVAIVNADDPMAADLVRRTPARVVEFGLGGDVDVTADVRRVDRDGLAFDLITPYGDVDVTCRLPGHHNLENAIAAATAAVELGYPLDSIRGGFLLLKGVPGRLEPIECGQDFRVLIDYAHTDHALEHVLRNLRPLTRGRIVTVFGCGGDRDRSKRPRMGRVATERSDLTIVTSDNPRTEEPSAIIEEILGGTSPGAEVVVEPDRRAAIERALRAARGGDIVLIAGKGHERVQLAGDEAREFDDRDVAREVLWSLS